MDIIFLRICLCCSLMSWAWVDKLTISRGLLDWNPRYYPNNLRLKPFGCAECLSGWTSLITSCVTFLSYYSTTDCRIYLYMLFSMPFSMAITHIITKR